MKVFITEAAWADMLDIGRTIQRDSPTRAETFLDEFFERCDSLARLPHAYPLLPGRETSGIRRRLYGNYLIFYRVSKNAIEVLHILHGARDYDRILFLDE